MKTIQFNANSNRSGDILHIETDGCIVNIHVGLTNTQGQQVTHISISPEDETRSPDLNGFYWHADGPTGIRVIRQEENGEPLPRRT